MTKREKGGKHIDEREKKSVEELKKTEVKEENGYKSVSDEDDCEQTYTENVSKIFSSLLMKPEMTTSFTLHSFRLSQLSFPNFFIIQEAEIWCEISYPQPQVLLLCEVFPNAAIELEDKDMNEALSDAMIKTSLFADDH